RRASGDLSDISEVRAARPARRCDQRRRLLPGAAAEAGRPGGAMAGRPADRHQSSDAAAGRGRGPRSAGRRRGSLAKAGRIRSVAPGAAERESTAGDAPAVSAGLESRAESAQRSHRGVALSASPTVETVETPHGASLQWDCTFPDTL